MVFNTDPNQRLWSWLWGEHASISTALHAKQRGGTPAVSHRMDRPSSVRTVSFSIPPLRLLSLLPLFGPCMPRKFRIHIRFIRQKAIAPPPLISFARFTCSALLRRYGISTSLLCSVAPHALSNQMENCNANESPMNKILSFVAMWTVKSNTPGGKSGKFLLEGVLSFQLQRYTSSN